MVRLVGLLLQPSKLYDLSCCPWTYLDAPDSGDHDG